MPFFPFARAAAVTATLLLPPAARAADPAAGRVLVGGACAMCHGVTAGSAMIGPTLYGVAGRPIASVPGYDYSAALRRHAGAAWTDANLDGWLADPAGWAPGNRMYYQGLADAKNRADVIAYLHTLGPAAAR